MGVLQMTNHQKHIIKLLQSQGHSYMQIALTLSISINTLKSYRRRNNKIVFVNNTRHQETKEVLNACNCKVHDKKRHSNLSWKGRMAA
jgi:DNA-binding CsgD family transcriptional regulator